MLGWYNKCSPLSIWEWTPLNICKHCPQVWPATATTLFICAKEIMRLWLHAVLTVGLNFKLKSLNIQIVVVLFLENKLCPCLKPVCSVHFELLRVPVKKKKCFSVGRNLYILIIECFVLLVLQREGGCPAQATAGPSGKGLVGQSEWPAAPCLNEYQLCLPAWATAPPSAHGCNWFIGDQPAVASESHLINVHSLTTMRLNS